MVSSVGKQDVTHICNKFTIYYKFQFVNYIRYLMDIRSVKRHADTTRAVLDNHVTHAKKRKKTKVEIKAKEIQKRMDEENEMKLFNTNKVAWICSQVNKHDNEIQKILTGLQSGVVVLVAIALTQSIGIVSNVLTNREKIAGWKNFITRALDKDEVHRAKLFKFLFQWNFDKGVQCSKCKEFKPPYDYGFNKNHKYGIAFSRCTDCCNKAQCPFKRMLSDMKNTKGVDDGVTVEFLKELWEKLKGICYYSGLKMSLDGGPFAVSPERLDNNIKKYTRKNLTLICRFLNTGCRTNMGREETGALLFFNSLLSELVQLVTEIIKPERNGHKRNVNKDVPEGYKCCNVCEQVLELSNFSKGGKCQTCKECYCAQTKARSRTPYGFMEKMANNAKWHAKKRGTKNRGDTSHECDDDILDQIIELYNKYGGRCLITGAPFVFTPGSPYAPSIDRIDDSKGYVRGNIRLICVALNTPQKPDLEKYYEIREDYFRENNMPIPPRTHSF